MRCQAEAKQSLYCVCLGTLISLDIPSSGSVNCSKSVSRKKKETKNNTKFEDEKAAEIKSSAETNVSVVTWKIGVRKRHAEN